MNSEWYVSDTLGRELRSLTYYARRPEAVVGATLSEVELGDGISTAAACLPRSLPTANLKGSAP